jgi:DMSO/TMAO reductase YedYZ molybdopterin-dependent catalytic subunit
LAETARGGPRESRGGALAGVLGGIAATLGMLAAGLVLDQPTIAEAVADGITSVTPLETIERMTKTFGDTAKRLLFISVLLGEIALGAVVGLAHGRLHWPPLPSIAAFAGLVALMALVALPALGMGVLGADSRAGAAGTLVSLLVASGLYVAGYAAADRALHPPGLYAAEEAASRRAFLARAGLAVGGLVAGIAAFQWIAERLTPSATSAVSAEAARANAVIANAADLVEALSAGVPGLSPEITPNDRFYVVSKNVFRDPVVNERTWRLEVTGLVDRPMVLTYDAMRALSSAGQFFTLQCISNEVGGSLIGNAAWRGVGLAHVLSQAGVKPGAVDVVLRAADDYADSIPIEKAMEPAAMLAYEMNGAVLPQAHGFPVRLLVPDTYGMKNVKWLTKIEVIEYDLKGYWQTRGWDDTARMNTTSQIDVPKNGSNLIAGRSFVGGIAVAGSRGVRNVEVSTDGGASWRPATMKPPLGPDAWALWLYEWALPAEDANPRRILVRATDGTGAVQISETRETLPAGATGHHTITVRPASA